MIIAAFDIATVTGLAVGDSGQIPRAWSVDLRKAGKSDEARFSEALRTAHGVIAANKPDLVVVEAPIGGKDANALLIGLAACVRGCAFNHGVRSVTIYPATVRKHFMGEAKTSRDFPGLSQAKAKIAIKKEVAARCRAIGWDITDLDAADAAATWDWAQATYARAQTTPVGGLFTCQ